MSGGAGSAERRLIDLLDEKKAALELFWELTLKQSDALERDDDDGLIQAIDERVPVIEKIDGIQSCLEGLGRQAGDDTDGRAALIEAEISELLVRIRDKDNENLKAVQSRLKGYGDQIRNLNRSRKGIESYHNPYKVTHTGFFDKKQ